MLACKGAEGRGRSQTLKNNGDGQEHNRTGKQSNGVADEILSGTHQECGRAAKG